MLEAVVVASASASTMEIMKKERVLLIFVSCPNLLLLHVIIG
jgi:hypothetical protein